MNKTELNKILDLHKHLHKLWISGDSKGKRANLEGANLEGADLTNAILPEDFAVNTSEKEEEQKDTNYIHISVVKRGFIVATNGLDDTVFTSFDEVVNFIQELNLQPK